MEKIELNGEIYYYINNRFVDSTFCSVDKTTNEKLSEIYFKNIDLNLFSKEQLLDFIKKTKDAEQFATTKTGCKVGLQKFGRDENFVKIILPILTSTLRNLNQPRLAIEVAQKYTDLLKCDSSALWLSVASCSCDIGEFKDALNFLKLAKQKSRTHSFEEESEFSLVENRIKKALDIDEI